MEHEAAEEMEAGPAPTNEEPQLLEADEAPEHNPTNEINNEAVVIIERIPDIIQQLEVPENEQSDGEHHDPPIPVVDICTPISNKKRKRHRSASRTPAIEDKQKILEENDDGTMCSICLDHWEMTGPHRLIALKCGHLFGHDCIKRWLQTCPYDFKTCPSCKARANPRDIRFIYAKRVCAVDNSEEHRLRDLLESEKKKYSKSEANIGILKIELAMTKNQLSKAEAELERLKKGGYTNSALGSSEMQTYSNITYKLYMEKNIEMPKDAGCRVMIYGRNTENLLVSQKSTQGLFPGFGVRFIDVRTYRPTTFLHMSTKSVRDLCYNSTEELLISANLDKCAKLFSINDRTVVKTFVPSDKPIWACSLDNETNNFVYLGSGHGSTFIYDIRQSDTVLEEFKNDGDMSPVINISPVPTSTSFPFGGFLVCKLQSVWFYEYVASQTVISTKLSVEGPFVSMSYDAPTNCVLISTRSSKKHNMSRYIVANIVKNDDVTTLEIVTELEGSKIQPVMSRCTRITMKDTALVAAYLQDRKTLSMWNLRESSKIQSMRMLDIVYDTCPIYHGGDTYLAALAECKCRVYKINSEE